MILKVGATGSSGNFYYLENNGEILLLDAGISIKEIKQIIDFRVGDVVGCTITHEHKDHALSAGKLEAMGIRVFRPYEYGQKKLKTKMGNYTIISFEVPHDGVECRAFLIESDCKTVLYATDFEYIGYKLNRNISLMLIECNYQEDLISAENDHRAHIYRGHAELHTVSDFVAKNATETLTDIVLCHASESGSLDKQNAVKVVKDNAPEAVRVHMAARGLTIEF